MSETSERIHAALLRFKTERSSTGDQPVKSAQPEEHSRQTVVVNEQNFAALFLLETPGRSRAAAKGK